jgi:dTDP-4-amino-4,6-dideoxygalactose transaminase
VINSGVLLNGPEVAAFARDFAEWCGAEHCVPVANGTDAIELSLRALGVEAGDEVVIAPNAGGYATFACNSIGAVPVWIDVRDDTLGLDAAALPAALSTRTRAVIVTHLFGIPADVPTVRRALDAAGASHVAIVEDCAQAHGARLGVRRVGTLGDIAAFSFYPTKNLGALGDAGAVLTSRQELADAVVELRQYGWRGKYVSERSHGRNSRMDEIQAAVLRVKLARLDDWNRRRRRVLESYAAQIAAPNTIVGAEVPGTVAHLVVLRSRQREAIRAALAAEAVHSDVHYPLLDPEQPSQKGRPGRSLSLSVSLAARNEILTLPSGPYLTDDEIAKVVGIVNRVAGDQAVPAAR